MAKILITGGAGFIGSHLAERLLEIGHEVIIFDNLDSFYSAKIKKKNLDIIGQKGDYEFIKGDIRDYGTIRKAMEDAKAVFHEAAQPGIRASMENPLKTNEVNIMGTLNVLYAAKEMGVEKVINISSSSVYGEIEYLPFDEKHPTNPISPYGVSKLAGEQYVRIFHEIYGLSTVTLRYFSVYGPRMRPDLATPIFTNALINNERATIFGDGEQSRDFTYINDIVNATERAMKTNNIDGEVFNIGSGKRVTINQIFEILEELLGKNIDPVYVEKKKGEVRHTHSNIGKAREILGYHPKFNIKKGLKNFVEWNLENDFYE